MDKRATMIISIHPSREGRDHGNTLLYPIWYDFNPPFPRGKGSSPSDRGGSGVQFQSTLPAREGISAILLLYKNLGISIHPSHEGRDRSICPQSFTLIVFQSTLPTREGIMLSGFAVSWMAISIHPSHEGRDASRSVYMPMVPLFQSTLPTREGIAPSPRSYAYGSNFNPPFPRGKGSLLLISRQSSSNFNPPFPRGKGSGSSPPSPGSRDFNPPFPRGKGSRESSGFICLI